MTIQFIGEPPPDIVIERKVDLAIASGCRLPRWGWPVPCAYNGTSGGERIIGWQKLRVAEDLDLLSAARSCGLCGSPDAPQWHTEIYFRPLTSKPVCRSCHFHIHRRFQKSEEWRRRVRQSPDAYDWVHHLRTHELSRTEALEIAACADVFAALGGAS